MDRITSTEISVVPSENHRLSRTTRYAYSVGHVLNDVCASMWFTYLLVYFHLVLKFDNKHAGYLLAIGQAVDALATPAVGIESDKNDCSRMWNYGRRKTWHLFGTFFVLISFPFLFTECLAGPNSNHYSQFLYYAPLVGIFQIGWAFVQISHLSMIPDITTNLNEKVELNTKRYTCTVISNLCVYAIAWAFFGTETEELGDEKAQIGPQDKKRFQNTMFCVVAIGIVATAVFHIFVKENRLSVSNEIPPEPISETNGAISSNLVSQSLEIKVHLRWRDWLCEGKFFKIALLYMSTRLYVNLSQVYIPLYLQDTLGLHRTSIAIIPLIAYGSGFVFSQLSQILSAKLGLKITYFLSICMALGTCGFIYYGKGYNYETKLIYIVAVLTGGASSVMLVTSLSLTSQLIGNNSSSGAFVYGLMSFFDKLANGGAIMLIQYKHPCDDCRIDDEFYYGKILTFVCGGAALTGLLGLLLLSREKLGTCHRTILIESCDPEDQTSPSRNYLTHAESVDDTVPLPIN